ncbi:hypothetical protein BBP40_003589 [Aspergillus hancockii]|nr:hypothetical protein BBP40_003589 [Aspergillus hancockii]
MAQGKIFFSAVLTSSAPVTVTVGGVSILATWENIPGGGVGEYHGIVGYGTFYDAVNVTLRRSGTAIAGFTGPAVTISCTDGCINWNAWVGKAISPFIWCKSPKLSISEQTCITGTSPATSMGSANSPAKACGTVEAPLTESTVSTFLPEAHIAGTGEGNLEELCSYACNFGFFTTHDCTCTATGDPPQPPAASTTFDAVYLKGDADDSGLCTFACQRTYCPPVRGSTEGEVLSCSDDDDKAECKQESPCDLTLTLDSWKALEKASDDISSACMRMYAAQVLMDTTLNTTLDNYTDMNNGYDEESGYYIKYLKKMVPCPQPWQTLGLKVTKVLATNTSRARGPTLTAARKRPTRAPSSTYRHQIIEYNLIDEEGFYNELKKTYGISNDWTKFITDIDESTCDMVGIGNGQPQAYQPRHDERRGFPHGKEIFDIPNPKDSISKALSHFHDLQLDLTATWGNLFFFPWDGDDNDAVEVLSTPVTMLLQVVDSMKPVEKVGEEEEKREKEANRKLIFIILSANSSFFRSLRKWLERRLRYNIAQDPKSASVELLSIHFAGAGRTTENFSQVAGVRRTITVEELTQLGSIFKNHDEILQDLIKVCEA